MTSTENIWKIIEDGQEERTAKAGTDRRDITQGQNRESKTTRIMADKTLDVTSVADAKAKVSDIQVFGNGDLWQLVQKASSKEQGWMKSTKALEIIGDVPSFTNPRETYKSVVGCLVQTETQQKNLDGTYALSQSVVFLPHVKIGTDDNGNRRLETI